MDRLTAASRLPSPWILAISLALSLVAGLAAEPLAAQDPERPAFEGEVQVSEVLLDVVVTDGDGNVVIGLDEDDFVVEEDGEAVELRSVSFYSNRRFLGPLEPAGDGEGASPEAGAPAGVTASDAPEERYFVLLFHRPPLHTNVHARTSDRRSYLALPKAGAGAFEWAVRELLPSDRVAVVGWQGRLLLYHDFTRDREQLAEAIERAALGKEPQRWTSRMESPHPQINLSALPEPEVLERETTELAGALGVLARGLGGIQGRKNLILFGGELPREGSRDWRVDVEPALEALNDHNVATYVVALARTGRQPSLLRLAEVTGGEYSYRFQDFRDPLRRIARQNSGYYLLSYRSTHPAGRSGYQEVEVRTRHEGFRVRSRSGYRYGADAAASAPDEAPGASRDRR